MPKSSQAIQNPVTNFFVNQPAALSTEALRRILGIRLPVPLTPAQMARSLRVAFYPSAGQSPKLGVFLRKLRKALVDSGAAVIPYAEALAEGAKGRVGKGIVLIAVGEGAPGNLAIDHVASLSENTVVGVLDGTLPGLSENRLQKRLNALIGALVWHMAHVVIYVDDASWTVCNMNGAIDTFGLASLKDRVLHTLIPKLAAPVIPPKKSDFSVFEGAFDPAVSEYRLPIGDLIAGGGQWAKTGLLTSQTKVEELVFRNNRYRRIAAAYLSWRTGMSYGFLARQLPLEIVPAVELKNTSPPIRRLDWNEKDFHEIGRRLYAAIKVGGRRFIMGVPPVSVLCTRSGCDKTDLDVSRDLVKLTLDGGKVILETPRGAAPGGDCQPSFDTTTILGHAVGNALVASVLAAINPASKFCHSLGRRGLALAHWHGYMDPSVWPAGYYSHGQTNLPVSCSTPQAAIYAVSGKLSAFQRSLVEGPEFLGDVHEEPSHGTNLTGKSLVKLALLVSEAAATQAV